MKFLTYSALITAALLFSVSTQAAESMISVSAKVPERFELREVGKDKMPDAIALTYEQGRGLLPKIISTEIHTNTPGTFFQLRLKEEPVLRTSGGQSIPLEVRWINADIAPSQAEARFSTGLFPLGHRTPLDGNGLAISKAVELRILPKDAQIIPTAGTYRGTLVLVLTTHT